MTLSTAQVIANAARRLFYEKGFHTCSVDEIARQSGLSRATIYLHFSNKDEILLHLLKDDLSHQMRQYEHLAAIRRLTLSEVKRWLLAFRASMDERRGSLNLFTASVSLGPELLLHVDHHRDNAIRLLGLRFAGFDLDALDRASRTVQRVKCYMMIFLIEEVTVTFSNAPSAPSLDDGIVLLADSLLEFLKTGAFRLE